MVPEQWRTREQMREQMREHMQEHTISRVHCLDCAVSLQVQHLVVGSRSSDSSPLVSSEYVVQ